MFMLGSRRKLTVLLAAVALVGVMAVSAKALINPNFTPQMLVEQSDTILIIKLNKVDARKRIPVDVVSVPKGKKPDGKVFIDLSSATQKAWAEHVAKLAAKRGDKPVPLFIGKYKEASEEEEAEAVEGALLQIDRDWVKLFQSKNDKNVWEMSHVDAKLQGTWDGGSDMLIKAIDYIKEAPDDSTVPVEVGVDWIDPIAIGKMVGGATSAVAVSLDGSDRFALHVGGRGGDRLVLFDRKAGKFNDVAAKRKLNAKSHVSAWGDYDGDGKTDLASWDGAALSVFLQGADGSFAKKVDVAVKPDGGCLGLIAVDAGVGGKAGLLVSSAKAPVLLKPAGGGRFEEVRFPDGSAMASKLGLASACLAADLDGDSFYDVLQPFEKGGLVFKGKGGGKFAAPVAVAISSTKGRVAVCVGDYDIDGLLDVYMVGKDCVRLWNNKGGLKFADVFGHSGEMSYTAQPGGISATTNDLNNDGLQDVFIAFAGDTLHHYFNRGYRSFGKSLSIVWENQELHPEFENGQQAGTIADLNGDGAQDMALVLKDGTLKIYPQEVFDDEDDQPLSVRAVIPAKAVNVGPVTVTGWADRRCVGSWSVTAGSTGGFFGLAAPGEITFKWKFPGGKEVSKKVEVEKKRKVFDLTSVGAPAASSGEKKPKSPTTATDPKAPTPKTGAGQETVVNGATIGGIVGGVVAVFLIVFLVRKKKSD